MAYFFLIDECLSPRLAEQAHAAGHQATSVRDRHWCGLKDHDIVRLAIEHDFTLVTNNALDFRGSTPAQAGGLYALEALHAGLVCLNAEVGILDRPKQLEAFSALLAHLPPDLINRAMEVTVLRHGGISLTEYAVPD